MKLTLIALLLSSACASAITTSITWEDDSRSAMTLHLEGSGLPEPAFVHTSPTGLWQLSGFVYAFHNLFHPPDTVVMGFLASLDFEGVFFTNTLGFDDIFPISGPLTSFEPWQTIFADPGGVFVLPWGGLNRFSTSSHPSPSDASTWDWDAVFQISGPELPASVPDTGYLLPVFCIVAVILLNIREKGGTQRSGQ